MDWIKGLVGKNQSAKRASISKKTSNERRYYVKPSDKKIVTAYKNPNGPGYVYHKRSASGTRNLPVRGNTYSTEKEAKERLERLKKSTAKKG